MAKDRGEFEKAGGNRGRLRRGQGGYAFLLVAAAVIAGGMLTYLGNLTVGPRQQLENAVQSRSGMDDVLRAIEAFSWSHNRLPCPAATNTTTGSEGCSTTGCPTTTRVGSIHGNIRVGLVPWQTIGVSRTTAMDDWRRFLTYAVSENLCETMRQNVGVISVSPNNNGSTPVRTDYAFVLVSHGRNGLGAANFAGLPMSQPEVLNAHDRTGLADPTVFVSRTITDDETAVVYFDDIVTPYLIGEAMPDLPQLSIIALANAVAPEGNAGETHTTVFTVQRSGNLGGASQVDWSVGGMVDAADFTAGTALSGTLSFAPTEASKTITLTVQGDTVAEPDETYMVSLSNPLGATITAGSASGTILDDDTPPPVPPTLSIAAPADAVAPEGNPPQTHATVFTVQRSGSVTGTSTVHWAVSGLVDAADFTPGTALSGNLTFAPTETTKTITLTVQGDTVAEPDETYTVTLSNPVGATLTVASASGAILDDDTPPPTLSIAAAANAIAPGRQHR